MYTSFYGLREKPFTLSPDPRFLFLADSHREALAHVLYGIDEGAGFIAITGEVGTGKTTLCRTLLQRLGRETEVAFVFNPTLTGVELLRAISVELGLSTDDKSRVQLSDQLNEFLVETHRAGRRALLIIDEAQNLAPDTLEEIRLFSNLETPTSKLIQILLFGQPELDEKLDSHELRQLRQRISVRWSLGPMSASETAEYVRHRLTIAAGYESRFFSDAALREVHRHSGGVPRIVNVLCDRSLLAGYAAGLREVGADIVREAAKEMYGSKRYGRDIPRWVPAAAVLSLLWVLLLGAFAWVQWGGREIAPPQASVTNLLPPVASAPPVSRAAPADPAEEAVSRHEPLPYRVELEDPAVAISVADDGEPG